MAMYLMLANYTPQGVRNIKEGPAQIDAFKRAAKEAGGEVKDFYLAMGAHDLAITLSAPDDETVARIALGLCALGNVETETTRLFTEQEYRKIVQSMK